MPIKYIGRTTSFKGKTLWEILGNLKNFGVGRMVIRNRFQRYPEPCFMRILKIATLPAPNKELQPHEDRKIVALIENTFRGKTYPPEQIDGCTYKADYVLIPKDEEEKYMYYNDPLNPRIVPRTMEYPPLLKELIIRQRQAAGVTVKEDPQLEIVYQWNGVKRYRLAEEGEEPTVKFGVDLGTPISPSLYANIRKESSTT
ncbi:PREDICTED: uncharacterized protein LOC107064834 [Polistes dominula]|uniref:Uncharacterized protein LOC107064834 n=1 Tax=Polistes dominula TaxID=743375 RepID=A0ABM1HZL2_POLDO|nr:PREDICTED: uncharacterized protein LOC107064834 [Polistes dominula]